MSCQHPKIEPVEIIGTDATTGLRYRAGSAYSCESCQGIWRYTEPEELPHWLYQRLKAKGALPMPALTPEIMAALYRDQVNAVALECAQASRPNTLRRDERT